MKKPHHLTTSAFKMGRFSAIAGPAVIGAFVLLAGCTTPRESHKVSSMPPAAPTQNVTSPASPNVVVTTTAPAANNVQYVTTATEVPGTNTIIVTQAPPAPPPEVIVAQPSTKHVWIPGYFTWRNNRYEWMAGHWEIPPKLNAQWISPRVEKDGNGYRFYEGYWN
jgi:hypothetical protein